MYVRPISTLSPFDKIPAGTRPADLPPVIALPFFAPPPKPGQPGYQPPVQPAADLTSASANLTSEVAPSPDVTSASADLTSDTVDMAKRSELGLLKIEDPELIVIAEEYKRLSTEYAKLEKAKKKLNERLKKAMGDHLTALAGSRTLNLSWTPPSVLDITPEMVNTTVTLRTGYYSLKVG